MSFDRHLFATVEETVSQSVPSCFNSFLMKRKFHKFSFLFDQDQYFRTDLISLRYMSSDLKFRFLISIKNPVTYSVAITVLGYLSYYCLESPLI